MSTAARRLVARALAVLAIASVATAFAIQPADAHTRLLGTTPVSGATVDGRISAIELRFDEVVRLVPRSLVVTGGSGAPLTMSAPRLSAGGKVLEGPLLDRLVPGSYHVAWRVLADDGHIVSGAFGFTVAVGAAASATAPAPPPAAPGQPLWPVLVAAGVALAAGLGAAVVVHRGLRALAGGAQPYPVDQASERHQPHLDTDRRHKQRRRVS